METNRNDCKKIYTFIYIYIYNIYTLSCNSIINIILTRSVLCHLAPRHYKSLLKISSLWAEIHQYFWYVDILLHIAWVAIHIYTIKQFFKLFCILCFFCTFFSFVFNSMNSIYPSVVALYICRVECTVHAYKGSFVLPLQYILTGSMYTVVNMPMNGTMKGTVCATEKVL